MKTKITMLLLVLGSWGANAQHDHAANAGEKKIDESKTIFKDSKLGVAYEHYLHLKDALVASNNNEAIGGANQLQKALKDINGATAALEATSKIALTSDLKEQRKAFSALSNEMATLVKSSKLSAGILYLEYCPMANSNKGAYWLSNEKEIKNPYFGDKMLRCGSVKETIQ